METSLAQFTTIETRLNQLSKRIDVLVKSVDRLAKQVNSFAKHADAVQEKNGMNIARLAKRLEDTATATAIHHAENATIYM